MRKRGEVKKREAAGYPIAHWSHSSLIAFLRNPLAWRKRYVEKIYDIPSTPSGIIGRAGHKALEHFYTGMGKEAAAALGLEYLRGVSDIDIAFGKAKTARARREKRAHMEREYLQAIGFYLHRAPRHRVLGVEVRGTATIAGLPLPIKAISDLVVESKVEPGAIDIVDHKFVDAFSKEQGEKTLFLIQALFNYHVVREQFGRPVRQFLVYECKKRKNANGGAQLRRYALDFRTLDEEFQVFNRLLREATEEIARQRHYLPNPSDMFEGEHSFDIYRLKL